MSLQALTASAFVYAMQMNMAGKLSGWDNRCGTVYFRLW